MSTVFSKLLYKSKLALNALAFIKGGVKKMQSYVRDGVALSEGVLAWRGEKVESGADIVILIVSHRRNSMLMRLTHYYSENISDLNYVILIVISDDDDELEELFLNDSLIENLVLIKSANLPVGNKWQLGVDYAKKIKPKSLMICGSDDYLTPLYINCSMQMLFNQGYSMVGSESWVVVQQDSDVEKCYMVKYTEKSLSKVLGSGRLYSQSFLDACDWVIFEARFDRGLDYRGLKLASNSHAGIGVCRAGYVVSMKGDWEMINPFSKMNDSDFIHIREMQSDDIELNKLKGTLF